MLLKIVLGVATLVTAERTPVVLVADVGVDDASALIWLAKDPTIDLLGVAASFGCHGDVRQTAANARRVLRAADRPCVPVYVGSPYALGESTPPSDDGSYVHGEDGLGSVAEAPEELQLPSCHVDETLSAAEFIAQTARERPGEITVIVTSPLTNLALAYLLEPQLPELVTRTLVMGGAVRHPGEPPRGEMPLDLLLPLVQRRQQAHVEVVDEPRARGALVAHGAAHLGPGGRALVVVDARLLDDRSSRAQCHSARRRRHEGAGYHRSHEEALECHYLDRCAN